MHPVSCWGVTSRTCPALRVALATPPRLLADTLAGLLVGAGDPPDDLEVEVLPDPLLTLPVRRASGVTTRLTGRAGAGDDLEVEVDHERAVDLAITVGAGPAPSARLVLVLDDGQGSTGGGTVYRPDGVALVRLANLDEVIDLVRRLAVGHRGEVGG